MSEDYEDLTEDAMAAAFEEGRRAGLREAAEHVHKNICEHSWVALGEIQAAEALAKTAPATEPSSRGPDTPYKGDSVT